MKLQIKKLYPDAQIPKYQSDGAAGLDLHALETVGFGHNDKLAVVGTGISVSIPDGYVGLIWDRGSMAKNGFHTIAGVVDSDYRGEIMVCMMNIWDSNNLIHKGQRIAQLLIVPCPQVEIEDVDELSDTARCEGRFGSTGR
jgi:dUTP pyrophosphatase